MAEFFRKQFIRNVLFWIGNGLSLALIGNAPGWEARGGAVARCSRGIFDKESRMTGAVTTKDENALRSV